MKFKSLSIFFIFLLCMALPIILLYKKSMSSAPIQKTVAPELVKHFKLHQLDLKQIDSSNDLLAWLDQEEKALWQELEKEIGLSYEVCQRLKKEKLQDYLDDLTFVEKDYGSRKPVSADTISFMQSVMKDFSINPQEIRIVAWNLSSAAAATDKILFVNEKNFTKLDTKAKKFTVGHELIHYLKKDHSTTFFIKQYRTKTLTYEKAFDSLTRFQEIRADILSSLQGSDYSEGNIIFFNDHIKSTGNDYGPPCHPKNSLRLAIGTKIAGFSKKLTIA